MYDVIEFWSCAEIQYSVLISEIGERSWETHSWNEGVYGGHLYLASWFVLSFLVSYLSRHTHRLEWPRDGYRLGSELPRSIWMPRFMVSVTSIYLVAGIVTLLHRFLTRFQLLFTRISLATFAGGFIEKIIRMWRSGRTSWYSYPLHPNNIIHMLNLCPQQGPYNGNCESMHCDAPSSISPTYWAQSCLGHSFYSLSLFFSSLSRQRHQVH